VKRILGDYRDSSPFESRSCVRECPSPVPAVAAGYASSPPSRTRSWPAPSSPTSASRSPPSRPAPPHPHLPRFPSPTALIGCSFAEPPPRPRTPSLTARPGESRIASTQRAPAGGYVAVCPRQVDVPGTGPGSGRVAGPRIAQHPPRTRVNDSYAPRLPRRVRQGPAGPHGRAILSDREQDGRGLALRFGRHHSRGRAGERRAPEV